MTHLWVRAEERPNEERVGITPAGVAALVAAGFRVTVEESRQRALPLAPYAAAGAEIAPEGAWRGAPAAALVFGLKELPEDGTPLTHRHILFGHAYKGQPAGQVLLRRFRAGGGTLLDLESLVDEAGRRVAAFGYWAGYAGAVLTLAAWAAGMRGGILGPVARFADRGALTDWVRGALAGLAVPRALVIGALGRVGTGACDLCAAAGVPVTRWDMAETARGGPFPQVLAHEVFLNCILARPGCPVFVPADAGPAPRALRAIGDIACDPTSDFSPVKVYDRATDWTAPVRRVWEAPVLDVMAIDNLPSLLPVESSEDFAAQLLPWLMRLDRPGEGVWGRAAALYAEQVARV
jgi:saccharopine dehydrogenase (NAD+, L-lysine-forming)